MLYQRVLSAAVGIPLFLLAVWSGGLTLFAVTALIMLFSVCELNKLYVKMELKPSLYVMTAGVIVLSASALAGGSRALGLALVPVILLILVSGVFRYPGADLTDIAAGLAGTLYISLFIYFYLIRTLAGGQVWMLALLAAIWAGDTLAYFTGKKFGKRKLAPDLSPGKTIEGAVGGIAGSILGVLLVYRLFPVMTPGQAMAVGLLAGVFGILGDLFESSLKRKAAIKDTGSVIPGHGGVLDRFDSMIFAAPAVYFYIIFFVIN